MRTQKEAHPDTAMSGWAKEPGQASRQGRASKCQSTTAAPPPQSVKIADFLCKGEAHAVPLRHLRELLHLPARTVRLLIRAERLAGSPILESSNPLGGGYYLPGSGRERARCVQRLRQRAAEIVRVADAIAAADIEGAAGLD